MYVWRGNDPDFAQKKIRKILEDKFVNNFEKLPKSEKGASAEIEILHGEKRNPVE